MTWQTLLLFLPACFALNMAFGPNNLLSLTVGAQYGVRAAVIAAIGRLVAFAIMIAIAAVGMGALLMASEMAFSVVKWAGVAYLVWIGLRLWRARPETGPGTLPARPARSDQIRREFLVAIGNPKAILIFTAFFPQFVAPSSYWQSFTILGLSFLLLEVIAIALYAFAGSRLQHVVQQARGMRLVNRISGAMMMGFGLLLALARRPS